MTHLALRAPLSGWCMPLGEVTDAVFAEGMAGDGLAIDPTSSIVLAPCDGEIVMAQGVKHAVTVRHGALEVLVHVGIDTVKLNGEGFELMVAAGDRVKAGQPLLRFDLDRMARHAASLQTPIVIAAGGTIVARALGRRVIAGDELMQVEITGAEATVAPRKVERRRTFRVPFEHGLHVRPAALVAAALRPFKSEVTLHWRGRDANGRSTVAMMALGARCGDAIEVSASGADATAALDALEALLSPVEAAPVRRRIEPAPTRRGRIEAAIASRGVAIGPAAQWAQAEMPVAERGTGPSGERAALARAIAAVRSHLDTLGSLAVAEQQALLRGHAELVEDPELRSRAESWIERGKSAAYAWRQAARATAEMLSGLDDPRMRERAADLRDLEMQVLRVLAGKPPGSTREFEPGTIVLADDLLPSQMLMLERQRVGGVCIARGGATSHVAILAAASGIPTLVASGHEILSIPDGTTVAIDAEHGWLDVDPPAAERATRERAAAQRATERAADLEAAQGVATTRDGVRITVNANLGGVGEVAAALQSGAEGCGLLRTEFLFLDRREAPGENEQHDEYQRIATALGGRPLAIRTMDVGGDKPLAYLPMAHEENPALGMRGLRASLTQPELLHTQLRAMVRVDPPGACRVLLPMVTEVEELLRAREWLQEAARTLGRPAPLLGVMIETPSSALLASQLAAEADFLSIGTNDLSQYTLAMDRGHPELARRLDALHPAVLRLVAMVADAARANGKSVSVCGALGSDVDALPILVGLGVHEMSATAAAIPRLKRTARNLDAAECTELAGRALEQQSAAAVRELAAYARARARAASTTGTEASP